jgi:hypothetical protein
MGGMTTTRVNPKIKRMIQLGTMLPLGQLGQGPLGQAKLGQGTLGRNQKVLKIMRRRPMAKKVEVKVRRQALT